MRKFFFLTMLLFLSSTVWSQLDARVLAVKGVKNTITANKNYIPNWDEQLILPENVENDGSGCVLSNAQSSGDGSSYSNLVDGDESTIFHTIWNESFKADEVPSGTGWHNLQVKLTDPVQVFVFTYTGRNSATWHDNPSDVQIFATNDDALGAAADYATSPNESWTEICELKEGFPTESLGKYTSPGIDMGAPYKYVRFVVKNTVIANTIDTRKYTKPEISGITWNVSEFQMYAAYETTNPAEILKALVDSLYDSNTAFTAGDQPGFYPEDKVLAYNDALNAAEDAIASGNDCESALATLRSALADTKASVIPITEGYYNIISGYATFADNQGCDFSLKAGVNHSLTWGEFTPTDPYSLFKFTAASDSSWFVQSVTTEEYLAGKAGTSVIQSTEVEGVPQLFRLISEGQYNITNLNNNIPICLNGASSSAWSGKIDTYLGGIGTTSAWYLRKVTDEEIINSIKENGANQIQADLLKVQIEEGKVARDKANDYETLITNAEQIKSNAQSNGDGSAYSNLIDGDKGSIFHSKWEDAMAVVTTEGTGYHNLQITLNKAVNKMKFTYIGRESSGGWHDNPNDIAIYGTNDAELGGSTAAADSTAWTKITEITEGFPGNVSSAEYASPIIDFPEAFKYVRFEVKHTTTMDGGNRANSFASPFYTGVTFNLAEFQMYNGVPAESSEYYTVAGMKDACDQLDALIAAAEEKIENKSATAADVTALEQAIKLVNSLYVDRSKLQSDMRDLLAKSNDIYGKVTAYKLITNADNNASGQISSNSSENTPRNYKDLIDGDNSTYYHTVWDTDGMKNESITAEEWAERCGVKANGVGYHNLQVRLNNPESKFYFTYVGRSSGTWSDNPDDIKIFATNDDELGASVDNADQDSWDEITRLNSDNTTFPGLGVSGGSYTSPVIELGKAYKYIRFVVLNTSAQYRSEADANSVNRLFKNPDVTGITWNLAEFQMYGIGEYTQYNSIAGMNSAADQLKSLVEAIEAKDYTAWTEDELASLQAAYDAVSSLYVDQDQLSNNVTELVRKARKLYSCTQGEPIITDASATTGQVLANSIQPSQGGGYENLIDDNYGSVFHSIWLNSNTDGVDAGMKDENITNDIWAGLMGDNPDEYKFVGVGYHNLQVRANHPISKFFLEYTGRNNATWSDSPTKIQVFATNDDELGASADNADQSSWDEIGTIVNDHGANVALLYFRSTPIDLGKEYKYVRMLITETTNSTRSEDVAKSINRFFAKPEVTGITWNVSELQMYEVGECSQVSYIDGMKEAADELYAQIADKENKQKSQLMPTDYNELLAAVEKVEALYADANLFQQKLAQVEEELNNAEIDETKIGYAPNQGVIDELQTVHDDAKAGVSAKPTKPEIDAAIAKLDAGLEAYGASMNNIKPYVWYYIKNTGVNATYAVAGGYLSASDANTGSTMTWKADNEQSGYSMWRFVPIEGVDGQYTIQNRMTTHFIGGYTGNGDNYKPVATAEGTPYAVQYIALGEMQLISQDTLNTKQVPLHGANANQALVSWPGKAHSASTWEIIPVEEVGTDYITLSVEPNSLNLFTFPFELSGDFSMSAVNSDIDVTTYVMNSITLEDDGTTKVGLKPQADFTAGEPMFLMVGDYTQYSKDQETLDLIIPISGEYGTEAKTINGVTGTFDAFTANKRRLGYVSADGIHLTQNTTVINGLSGIIDPNAVVNGEDSDDIIYITINGKLDAINKVVETENAIVNVYTIDGKLIKRNVKAADATKNLNKGIYIIGKKKVAVK